MKVMQFLQLHTRHIANVSTFIWNLLWSKGWSFFLLYTILYFLHCFYSWDKLKLRNIQIELEMVSRYGSVSFWQLYPFQIVSIYFLYLFYFCFSILLVFLFLKLKKININYQLFQLSKKITQLFFLLILCLYVGNLSISLLQESHFYSKYLLVFWILLFFIFIGENGRSFSSTLRMVTNLNPNITKSIGYGIPLLWSGLMFWIVSI